jgi:hypothetical protein
MPWPPPSGKRRGLPSAGLKRASSLFNQTPSTEKYCQGVVEASAEALALFPFVAQI